MIRFVSGFVIFFLIKKCFIGFYSNLWLSFVHIMYINIHKGNLSRPSAQVFKGAGNK